MASILLAAFSGSMAVLVYSLKTGGDDVPKAPTITLTSTPEPAQTALPPAPPLVIPGTVPAAVPSVLNTMPSGIINLTDWKLTLPNGDDDDEPAEVSQPRLSTFTDPRFFHVDTVGQGVVFRAQSGGATTANSSYPRSELREMTNGGKSEAKWSSKSGTHVMTITEAITALPRKKPEVVAGQIHDSEDDVIMIRLNGSKLFVESDGDVVGVLDPAYVLGTRFTVQIVASDGRIQVTYNGLKTVSLKRSGSGFYFKAGCYTQSNEDDDDGKVFGEVVIYALSVQHS